MYSLRRLICWWWIPLIICSLAVFYCLVGMKMGKDTAAMCVGWSLAATFIIAMLFNKEAITFIAMTVFGTGAAAAALFAGEYDFVAICAFMALAGSFLSSRYHCVPYTDVIGTVILSGVTVFTGMKMGLTIQSVIVSGVVALFLAKVAWEPESTK